MKSNDVNVDTRLVLTNAIYLKGQWAGAFPKSATHNAVFKRSHKEPIRDPKQQLFDPDSGGDPVKVPMMRKSRQQLPYASVVGMQILEFPYLGDRASMVLLLPEPKRDIADLERSLSAEKLAAWIGQLKPSRIDVSLPRFKIELESRLKETLESMGMPLPFAPRAADFTGMNSRGGLFISAVIHKALVEVDEEGTVAAASTAAVIQEVSLPPPFPCRPSFSVPHPRPCDRQYLVHGPRE